MVAQTASTGSPSASRSKTAVDGRFALTLAPAVRRVSTELLAKGFTLQYDNTFQDCDGSTRHQALWRKGGSDESH